MCCRAEKPRLFGVKVFAPVLPPEQNGIRLDDSLPTSHTNVIGDLESPSLSQHRQSVLEQDLESDSGNLSHDPTMSHLGVDAPISIQDTSIRP